MTHIRVLTLAGNPIEDTRPLANHRLHADGSYYIDIDILVNRNVVIPDEALRQNYPQSTFPSTVDQITRLDLNNLTQTPWIGCRDNGSHRT